ncbi:hypothetical protein VMCG_05522 [Cytospora schulzeri]|uniref:Aminoglycoside phosphotransferase domain-containing protein n=1 Tax=Cytospora schulzeri TaxID=448051 RepID=A0A423WF39_9PEZI|nr:hypothetical protein VMCG_05522 [Valsa malicola]
MNSIYPEVNEALSIIESTELSHPSGALLSSFITEALDPASAAEFVLARCPAGYNDDDKRAHLLSLVDDWTYIVECISQHGSPPPAPDPTERQAIIRRDGARCCITGSPGRLWDPLVIEPILPVPSGWINQDRPGISDMLGAFFSPAYRDWWLSYSRGPRYAYTSTYHNHWLVTRSAAHAFSRGVIKLDRLQPSMVEYEVLHVPIGPEHPIQVDGSYPLLGDHSRAGTLTVDPRFVGTHARLCRSIQFVELSKRFSLNGASSQAQLTPAASRSEQLSFTYIPNPWPRLASLKKPFVAALLAAWLLIPSPVRIVAYRALRQAAKFFIEPDGDTVQQLPFGLYLKCGGDLDSLRNEANALHMVRRYTSIPVPKPLDFVTVPAHAETRFSGEKSYLLMSRIPGLPLSCCHEVLSDKDSAQIAAQLQNYITQLRAIPKTVNPSKAICDTLGGACRDSCVRGGNPIGPFVDEAAFSQMLRNPDEPSRRGHRIFFTHADLNPRNILVYETIRQDGSRGWSVTGIVDWEMAGYYPEYWEYTKALYERFRWTRRYQNMVHGLFRRFGDYSKEFDVERRSWEAGI